MSDLSYIERDRLERCFDMGDGYVLDFSNRTFQEFVLDSVGLDIYEAKYDYESGSKANRLRAIWKKEPNHVAGKLISDLLGYRGTPAHDSEDLETYTECLHVAVRLQTAAPVLDIDALTPNSGGAAFSLLAKEVRDAIGRNEPEAGIDRLHTFMVKYLRVLCRTRGIDTERSKPLHGLFGEYVKSLRGDGLIESEMTERILKSTISTLEAFNKVRNDRSLAHDNPVLSHSESLLIFNHIASAVRFIAALEEGEPKACKPGSQEAKAVGFDDDVPF